MISWLRFCGQLDGALESLPEWVSGRLGSCRHHGQQLKLAGQALSRCPFHCRRGWRPWLGPYKEWLQALLAPADTSTKLLSVAKAELAVASEEQLRGCARAEVRCMLAGRRSRSASPCKAASMALAVQVQPCCGKADLEARGAVAGAGGPFGHLEEFVQYGAG